MRFPIVTAALLTAALVLGCSPAAETMTAESHSGEVDRVESDERLAPLEAFLDFNDVHVTRFREVALTPGIRAQSEYEIEVRVGGHPSTLRAMVYESAADAEAYGRVFSNVSRGDVPPRGGGGQLNPYVRVYRSGALVVEASGSRGMLVHQRLRDVFGQAQPR